MRLLLIGILMGFPLLEGAVLYQLATGPSGHGGWVLAWLVFAFIAGDIVPCINFVLSRSTRAWGVVAKA